MIYKFYNSGNFFRRIVFTLITITLFMLGVHGGFITTGFWVNTSVFSIVAAIILVLSLCVFLFTALTDLILDFTSGGYRLGIHEKFLWSREVAANGRILWANIKHIEISYVKSSLSHFLVRNPFINTTYIYVEFKEPVLVGRFRKKMQDSIMIPIDFLNESPSAIEGKIYECFPDAKIR